jgi:hypothetical protein
VRIDGSPLLNHIEFYRRELFIRALSSFDALGRGDARIAVSASAIVDDSRVAHSRRNYDTENEAKLPLITSLVYYSDDQLDCSPGAANGHALRHLPRGTQWGYGVKQAPLYAADSETWTRPVIPTLLGPV